MTLRPPPPPPAQGARGAGWLSRNALLVLAAAVLMAAVIVAVSISGLAHSVSCRPVDSPRESTYGTYDFEFPPPGC